MRTSIGDYWREALLKWSIPKEILEQAPVSPWIHPVELFQVPAEIPPTISHLKAKEVNPVSILDIGCGGGIAAFAVTPPAKTVIGVDHQPEMLREFERNATQRGLKAQTFEGFWPDLAKEVPTADVVVTHHVLFNVQEIENFLIELDNHAKKRVVIEIPRFHPLTDSSYLWQYFWKLERPTTPTAEDVLKILNELGIEAKIEYWESDFKREIDPLKSIEFNRIRLCLDSSKDEEIARLMKNQEPAQRKLATIWWDK
jgi:SAM-dependent methyltransferase